MQKFLRTLMLLAVMILPFASQAQNLTVCDGTVNSQYVPFDGYNADGAQHNQMLYPATDLTAMNGQAITQMVFYIDPSASNGTNTAASRLGTWTVSLGETTATTLSGLDNTTSLTQVYQGYFDCSTGTLTLEFDQAYVYNGGNLLVDLNHAAASWNRWYFLGVTTTADASYNSYNSASYTFLPKCTFTYGAVPTCFKVTNLAIDAAQTTNSSLTLTWTDALNTGATYKVYNMSDTSLVATGISGTTYTVTGLNANTIYTFAVMTDCGSGDVTDLTAPVMGRTACAATTALPYVEEFNGYSGFPTYPYYGPSVLPACWIYYSNGTNTAETTGSSVYYGGVALSTSTSYGSHEANNPYLYMPIQLTGSAVTSSTYLGYATARGDVRYAVLPAFATAISGLQIGFDYKMSSAYSATGAAAVLELGYVTNDDVTTFVSMWSQNAVTTVQHVVDLNLSTLAAAAPAGARLAFKFSGVHNGTGTSSYSNVACGIDNIVVENLPSCARVTNLTASGITNNSVTLNWSDTVNTGATYTVSDATGVIASGITGTTYTVTNLTGNTEYTFSVVTNCSATDASAATTLSVHTDCDAMTTLPYLQTFENEATTSSTSDAFAECWNHLNNGTQYFGHPYISSSSTYNHTDGGTKGLYWTNSVTTGTYGDYQCIVLPGLGGNYSVSDCRLKFWAKASSTSYHPVFYVGVLTDAHDINTFVLVDSVNVEGTTWTEYTANLTGYNGNGQFVAIRANRPASTWYAYVDDILLEEMPSCVEISDLTAGNITDNSITLSWTDAVNTSATYTVSDAEGVIASGITGTTYTVTGLTANTAYTFSVVANCSATDASPAISVSTRTACLANTVFPWSDDFESYSASSSGVTLSADCWVNEHISGGGSSLFQVYSGTMSNNATNKLRLPDMTSGTMTKLMLPAMNIPTGTTYLFSLDVLRNATGTSYTTEGVRVYASTNGEIEGATELGFLYRNYTQTDGGVVAAESASGWYTYDFVIPFTGTVYIILRGESKYGAATYMDNFVIEEAPSCLPPTGLAVNYIGGTNNAAQLTWTSDATLFNVSINDTVTYGFATSSPATVTGLDPNTTYTFKVQASCGDAVSEWTSPVSIHTPCAAEALPFTETFDATLASNTCWNGASILYTDNVNVTMGACSNWTYSSSASNGIEAGHYRVNIYGSSCYKWLITPGIDLSTASNPLLTFDAVFTAYSGTAAASGFENNESQLFLVLASTDNGATWNTVSNISLASIAGTSYLPQYVSLSAYAGQTVRLAFYAQSTTSGGDNNLHIDNIAVNDFSGTICYAPSDLTADSVTANSVTLNWIDTENDSVTYTVYNDSVVVATGITGTTYTVTGLTDWTDYTFSVVANCSADDASSAVSVSARTLMAPIMCGNDEADTYANVDTVTGTTSYFPAYSLYNYSYSEVIVPAARLTGLGEIKAMQFNVATTNTGSSYLDNCEVYLMNTTATSLADGFIQDTANFQLVYSGSLNHDATGLFTVLFQNNFMWNGTDNLLVAVRRNTGTWASAPTYAACTGTDTLARYAYNDDDAYTIGEITGGTAITTVPLYNFIGCPADPCSIAQPLPFTETFETASATLDCWTTDGPGNWQYGSYSSTGATYEGSAYAYIRHSSNGYVTKLISPALNASSAATALQLSFAHIQKSWSGDQDEMRVYYRTSADGTWIMAAEYTSDIQNWAADSVIVPANTYQVAFEMTDGYGYGVGVDSVVVTEMTTAYCYPANSIAAEVTMTSATLTWSGNSTSYQVTVSDGTTNVYDGVVNDTTLALTGLTAETNYSVNIWAICGVGDTSDVATASFFTGYCTPNPTSVDGNGITSVSFGGMTNTTSHASSAAYINNSAMAGSVPAGSTATLDITYATGYTYGTIVWVDWNNSLTFDGNEVVAVGTSDNTNPTTLTLTFDVPLNTTLGNYRMRILASDSYFDSYTGSIADAANANPCATYSYGVAEDYTLTVTEAPACLAPNGLVATPAAFSVDLAWNDQNNGSSTYSIYDMAAGSLVLIASNVTGTNYTVTGLSSETNYTFGVQANCSATETSDMVTVSTTTLISCPVPTALNVTLTPGNGTVATLAWTAGAQETAWQICLNDDTSNIIDVTTNPYTLTNLTAEQVYTAKVRAYCDVTDQSAWSNTVTFTPTNAYNIIVNDGTTTNGNVPIYGLWVDDITKSQFIIPATDLAAMQYGAINKLTFYASNASVNWGAAEFNVYLTETTDSVISALADYNTMTQVYAGTLSINNNIMEVNFTTPYLYMGGNLMVGFLQTVSGTYQSCSWYGVQAPSGASWGGYGSSVSAKSFLPKTKIDYTPGTAPSCLPVTGLTASDITATGATLTWNGDASSYNVYAIGATDTTFVQNVTTTTITLTGLTAMTNYTYGVTAVCTTDESIMMSTSFTTACSAVAIPFTEGFEATSGTLACWSVYATSNSTGIVTNASDYAHTGDGVFAFSFSTNPPQFLISPELSGTGSQLQVEFDYRIMSATYPESFVIGYSTTTADTSAFTWGTEQTNLVNETYAHYTEVLNASGIKYVAVKYTANDMYYLFIDDVVIRDVPACAAVTNLTVDSVTTTSVSLSWTDTENTGATYTVYNMADSSVVATGLTVTNYTVTGLTAATAYTFGVVANCSATEAGDFVTVAAMTACDDVTMLPYNEGFENGLGCWTSVNGSTDGVDWNAQGSFSSGAVTPHTGNMMAASWSWNSSSMHANAWLISPKFILPTVATGDSLTLTWWERTNANYPDSYSVVISSTTNDTTAFTTVIRPYGLADTTGEWTLRTVDLTSYAGQSIYVAFHHVDYDMNYLLIDDIALFQGAYVPPAPDTLTVTFAVNDATMGTTIPAPGTYQYLTGDTVEFSAVANTGYRFIGWLWEAGSSVDTLDANYISASFLANTFMSYGSMTFTALFEVGNPDSTTITYAVNDATMGTTTPAPGTYTIYVGNSITASATPNAGYELQAWVFDIILGGSVYSSDTITSSDADFDNPITFGVLPQNFVDYGASLAVTAVFGPASNPVGDTLVLVMATADATMGTTNPAPGTYTIAMTGDATNDNPVVEAIANNGYHFEYWVVESQRLDGSVGVDTITVNSNQLNGPLAASLYTSWTWTAYFAPDQQVQTITVTFDVNDASMGTIDPRGTVVLNCGETYTVTATAFEGYEHYAWYIRVGEDSVLLPNTTPGATASYDFTVPNIELTGDAVVIAYFRPVNGINDVDANDFTVTSIDNRVIVSGVENQDVYIYDVNGRIVRQQAKAAETVEFSVATSGVYLVKVGNAPAKRIVVVR